MNARHSVSLLFAAHNEGDLLVRTIASTYDAHPGLPLEVVVTDDNSTDESHNLVRQKFPKVAILRNQSRLGPSPSKDLAARSSQGEVLIFMDAHCKPQAKAFHQLLQAIDETAGEAIITPRIAALDVKTWRNKHHKIAHGSNIDLTRLRTSWLTTSEMRPQGRFFESPTLVGSCFAITRRLYERLGGFDTDMRLWGHEDLDLALKAWTMGHAVLHDVGPVVGHRFQEHFSYPVPAWAPLMNQMRIALKHYSPPVWHEWRRQAREREPAEVWEDAWNAFVRLRGSAETQRVDLLQARKYDEFWFAERFGLPWPIRQGESAAS